MVEVCESLSGCSGGSDGLKQWWKYTWWVKARASRWSPHSVAVAAGGDGGGSLLRGQKYHHHLPQQ